MDLATLKLPRRLVEIAEARGIDIEELALNSLREAMNLDPGVVAEARIELAERFLEEAREYIARRDAMKASEKLYKAVEELIKALAETFKAPQLDEVRKRGKWDAWILGWAATDLAKMLKEDRVRLAWKDAYDIHVWGFHEAKYRVEDVEASLPLAEWLLGYAKQVLREHVESRSGGLGLVARGSGELFWVEQCVF